MFTDLWGGRGRPWPRALAFRLRLLRGQFLCEGSLDLKPTIPKLARVPESQGSLHADRRLRLPKAWRDWSVDLHLTRFLRMGT